MSAVKQELEKVIGELSEDESRILLKFAEWLKENGEELNTLPVIGNVDFGHTDPKITFPIGGLVSLEASEDTVKLVIQEH